MAATRSKKGASKGRTSKQAAAERKAAARKAQETKVLKGMPVPELRFAEDGKVVTDQPVESEEK